MKLGVFTVPVKGQRLLNSTRLLIGEAKSTGNPWLMFTDPDVPIGYK